MTREEAIAARSKYGGIKQAARALGVSYSMMQRRLAGEGEGRPVTPAPATPAQAPLGGIALSSARVSVDKPAEGLKRLIYALKRGMGYPVEQIAAQWCRSTDSVRKHAREHGALLYVEVAPGDWKTCVLHPDTAAEYRRKAGEK